VAEWLRAKGVGAIFTSEEMREAHPGVVQIDRRMRELRELGWVIRSNQTDPNLSPQEYRLDAIGEEAASTGQRRPISGRVRRELFEAAGNRCQVCGVGAGETYADAPGLIARLQIGHWVPINQKGSPTALGNLRVECQRCNEAIRNRTGGVVTSESVRARVQALPRQQRAELLSWMEHGNRDVPDTERLWYEIRQLPPDGKREIREFLQSTLRSR